MLMYVRRRGTTQQKQQQQLTDLMQEFASTRKLLYARIL